MPPDFDDKLDLFDKMNVIKIFKPEKIMFGISNFVEKRIGKFYLEIPTINMLEIYKD
jgi:hypothetical protein